MDAQLIGGAGGTLQASGDYMYNTRSHVEPTLTIQGGLWGIFRVYAEGAFTRIKPLAKPVLPPPPTPGELAKVTNVSSTNADGTYTAGRIISLTFDKAVWVSTLLGRPTLTLETGAIDKNASYSSGSRTNVLKFTYIVRTGDASSDLDYVSTNALSLNGGTIKDTSGNNVDLTLPAPGAPGSLGANKNLRIGL